MLLGGTYRMDRNDPQCEPLDGWDEYDRAKEAEEAAEVDARLDDMQNDE